MANVKWSDNTVFVPQASIGTSDYIMGLTGADVNAKYPASLFANALKNIDVAVATQAMLTNTSYTTNDAASLVTYTLPTTAAVGDVIEITGNSANGWTLIFGTGQKVVIGSSVSTATTGSISSSNRYDSVRLKCVIANTQWNALGGPQGSLTIV